MQRGDLKASAHAWAAELGFAACRVAPLSLGEAPAGLRAWLAAGYHGEMHYMDRHAALRAEPTSLLAEARCAVVVAMPYLPAAVVGADATPHDAAPAHWQTVHWARLRQPGEAVVSYYAHGRDYHKVMRARLDALAQRLKLASPNPADVSYRVFTDSAPVMEAELAVRAGLGWRGKHTLVLRRDAGSMFFLGGFLCTLPLATDAPVEGHCGKCQACIEVCPTQAIVAPYQLDARRCISYLTIEHAGPIPVEFRSAIGARIYGCDDCQVICPWNKFARPTALADFQPRHGLDSAQLLSLWHWDELQFGDRLAGSPIRRIGWARWRRNLAVAMGNALRVVSLGGDASRANTLRDALVQARTSASPLVLEHIDWALAQASFSRG